MAAFSFDPTRCHGSIVVYCIVYLLICQITPAVGKTNQHISAFFQGECPGFCNQGCRDIAEHVGHVCECWDGFSLNKDGFSCSEIQEVAKVDHHLPLTSLTLDHPHSKLPLDSDSGDKVHLSDTTYKLYSTNNTHNSETRTNTGSNSDTNSHTSEKLINLDTKNGVVLSEVNSISLHEPIKVEHFDHKDEAPSLESAALRHELDSHRHKDPDSLHSLVPDYLQDYGGVKLGSGVLSAVEDNLRSELCKGVFCQNNGTCVIDGHSARCDCHLGTGGLRCEKAVEVRYPKFYGTGYLGLAPLKEAHKEFEIFLEFQPMTKYGLLLFSAKEAAARTDFFSVAIVDGCVEFRFDCGTGIGVLRSDHEVAMGQWNMVKISRQDNKATLWLNDRPPVEGMSKGTFNRITLQLNVYLGGYDDLDVISDKIGTRKGFIGCVERLVINGYLYDLRPIAKYGDTIFGVNVGECSEGVCDDVECQNSGRCIVRSADSHVCLCPLGTGGENCQHITEVHIPEFNGFSYLRYPGLGRTALSFLEIELVIKPTSADGLILYNGYTLDRQGDFVSLAMSEGYLEFRFDLGTGPAIIRSPHMLVLNQWHWIKISRTGLEGIMEIDDQVVAIGQSEGAFTQLTLTLDLYVGGHSNYDETSKFSNVSSSFTGCIQKIVINNNGLDLLADAVGGVNVESCEHPCVGQPCLNNGECVPKRDVYACSCPLGFTGTNCEQSIDEPLDTPRFSGQSFLMYTQKKISKRVVGDRLDLQMYIKPESPNGLLFWSGQDEMTASSDYIALGFVHGALQFKYNLGSGEAKMSYNDSKLFDGNWHYIHAQRDRQDGYLSVDNREIVEGSSKGSYTVLNTNKILYIGGIPDVERNTMQKFSSGFVGCIQEVELAEDYNIDLINSAQSGRNVVPCL